MLEKSEQYSQVRVRSQKITGYHFFMNFVTKLGITSKNHLSSASKRALMWPEVGNEWFVHFDSLNPLKGDLAYEEGIVS